MSNTSADPVREHSNNRRTSTNMPIKLRHTNSDTADARLKIESPKTISALSTKTTVHSINGMWTISNIWNKPNPTLSMNFAKALRAKLLFTATKKNKILSVVVITNWHFG